MARYLLQNVEEMIAVKPGLSIKFFAAQLLSVFLFLCFLFLSDCRVLEQQQRANTELSVPAIVSSKQIVSYKYFQAPGPKNKSKDTDILDGFVQQLLCYATLINTSELSNVIQARSGDPINLILVKGLRPRISIEGEFVAIISAQAVVA
jgi:hypothetical protein